MDAYTLICDTNRALAEGIEFTGTEHGAVADRFLAAVDKKETVVRYHRAVNATGEGRALYPLFYIPPYNDGKRLRLFTGELPKTQILSANHYELEILRLLAQWAPEHPSVKHMLEETSVRLRSACFARFCTMGECVGAGIAAMRYYMAAYGPDDARAVLLRTSLIRLYAEDTGIRQGKSPANKNIPLYYFWAAMTDKTCMDRVDNNMLAFISSERKNLRRLLTRIRQDVYAGIKRRVLQNALTAGEV